MGNIIKSAELKERGSAIYYEEKRVGLVLHWNQSIKLFDSSLKNAVRERYPGYTILERLDE